MLFEVLAEEILAVIVAVGGADDGVDVVGGWGYALGAASACQRGPW